MDIYCLSTIAATLPIRMTFDFIFNRPVLETQDSASLSPVGTLEKSVVPQFRTALKKRKKEMSTVHAKGSQIKDL